MVPSHPGRPSAAPRLQWRRRGQLVSALERDGEARAAAAEAGQDEGHQHITYYKCVDDISVRGTPIDYLGAMREMESLPAASGPYRFIGFVNGRNGDNVQFIRLGDDLWYADVPIGAGVDWDGYYWGARADSRSVADMLRLFFEEMPWLGMLPFTMRRHRG